jgi:hypothetical protein
MYQRVMILLAVALFQIGVVRAGGIMKELRFDKA